MFSFFTKEGTSAFIDDQIIIDTEDECIEKWADIATHWSDHDSLSRKTSLRYICNGIPESLRCILWKRFAGLDSQTFINNYHLSYDIASTLTESLNFSKQIAIDSRRTFPFHEKFQSLDGQQTLYRIMLTFSAVDPGLGYCQGMPFLAAMFCIHLPEEDAFALLFEFVQSYKIRCLFLPGLPLLNVALYQLNCALAYLDTELSDHFSAHGVNVGMYITPWIMTVFTRNFPFPLSCHIMDYILLVGRDAELGALDPIFRVALAILIDNRAEFFHRSFDEIMHYLRHGIQAEYVDDINRSRGHLHSPNPSSVHLISVASSLTLPVSKLKQWSRDYQDQENANSETTNTT